jgi:ribosomal protein L14E/L6E/L27E
MDSSEEVSVGQVVKSRAGRDKGRVFLIYDIIDNHNFVIVDGDVRKLNNPKQKKLKHLIVYNEVLSELKDKIDGKVKINDAYIRKLLEPFNKSF